MIKQFEGLIQRIENDIAYIEVVDEKGKVSYLEFPVSELKKNEIEIKIGIIFSIVLEERNGKEEISIFPLEAEVLTVEEYEKLLKYYEDNYGDV